MRLALRENWLPLLCATAVFLIGANASDAQEQPTAEQMRLLNQLPPNERQQALDAIRQSQTSRATNNADETNTDLPVALEGQENSDETEQDIASAELRALAGSRLVIKLEPLFTLTELELAELDDDPVLSRLKGSRHYELDDSGVLELPGLAKVPLLGLKSEEIVTRLGAEPALSVFWITAELLASEPIGIEALVPYGYDIFDSEGSGFEPIVSGPVPPDYVLGPGDSIRIQFFGNLNSVYEYEVSRDGILNLPDLGPITVAGLAFSEFRSDLDKRVAEMLVGTQVSVTMGRLRTQRIFVLGDANKPGSYVVGSLATISSALYSSGGINHIGSLRDIQLKRQGRIVSRFDLYDLLINGDTSADSRLQPGDVIFIPPVGGTVSVAGAVRRPAIYELKGRETVADVIGLAGGLHSDAYPAESLLERIDEDKNRIVISVDASSVAGANMSVSTGDSLTIPKVLPEFGDSVVLEGYVQRPGAYQWRPGMRLTDLLTSARSLQAGADSNYILIRRENPLDRTIQVLSANLETALANPGSAENLELQERDTVQVFNMTFGRQRVIEPILEELRLQARYGDPYSEVQIGGNVRAPGSYPLEPDMRISDLIRAGGSMEEGAYAQEAELTRYAVVNGQYRTKDIIGIDLASILNGDPTADLVLSAHDHLKISLVPDWQSDWSVMLDGEVKFPGDYQVRRGETLNEVIQRAGGLTQYAYPEGSVFLRESLKEREKDQLNVLIRRMETDLAAISLETLDTTGSEALVTGQALLDQLREFEPVGRLVIDITDSKDDTDQIIFANRIELRNGDQLFVPATPQEVTVLGEVQYTTSHLYQPGLVRDDYIALSGGLTRKADKKQVYVVRASGSVVASSGSKWFGRGAKTEILPGDTIVVPLDTDRIRPLTFWTNVTQILYQGAIAVAAVNSF